MAGNLTEAEEMGNLTEAEEIENIKSYLDSFFLIVMGCIVFLMQCGFALLEAGAVRSKNTVNILIKNMLDALIGGVVYWACGWAFAYGEGSSGFMGTSQFFFVGFDGKDYPSWFFQFVFAATTATIVSGAIAERCTMVAYFAYSIILTGWVYPVVSHWAWDSDGWLNQNGYMDFAGSGVVHLTGGICALVATFLMQPRIGRFTKLGKPVDMAGHSVPLAGLGGFILLFGFLAFNGGSQLTISGPGDVETVGLAIVNTIIGGCSSGLGVLLINRFILGRKWSYLMSLNGALTGMVSQCAGCNVYQPWAAFIIGVISGPVYLGVSSLMLRFKLDDPLDAVAVHAGGGILGVICAPFFMNDKGIFWMASLEEDEVGTTLNALAFNLAGMFAIGAWAAFWSLTIFGTLKGVRMLRVDRETEVRGNDLVKHGEAAYPRDAWLELQYAVKNTIQAGNITPISSATITRTIPGIRENGVEPEPDYHQDPNALLPVMSKIFKRSISFKY